MELSCSIGVDAHQRKATIPLETGYTMTLDWGDASHSDNYERWRGGYPFEETPLTAEMFIVNRKGIPVSWFSFTGVKSVNEILDDLITSGTLPSPRVGVMTT